MPLQQFDIEVLKLFNETAEELINSSLVIESNEDTPEFQYKWNLNPNTNDLDFSYNKKNHKEDEIKSFILTMRFFIQDNEKISIRNLSKLYASMNIDIKYKTIFNKYRNNLNCFLNEKALTFIEPSITKKDVYDTILYGYYAHKQSDKLKTIQTWKNDQFDWDTIFFEFQRILHEFVKYIKQIKNLNELILNQYP